MDLLDFLAAKWLPLLLSAVAAYLLGSFNPAILVGRYFAKQDIRDMGSGNPFFSTDSAASLRAAEIEADIIFKATMVDGVYDSDPKTNPDAKKYDTISHQEVLSKGLNVMDSTAAAMCRDNNIPILVFSIEDPDNIYKAVCGENVGTVVSNDE